METKAVQMISSMVRLCGIQDSASAVHSLHCNPIHSLVLPTFKNTSSNSFPCSWLEMLYVHSTQFDMRPGILSMTLHIQNVCDKMLVLLRHSFK